jgi:hypothetical protein
MRGGRSIDDFVQVTAEVRGHGLRMPRTISCLTLFAALAAGVAGAAPPTPARSPAMHEYALLFRSRRAVTPEQAARRAAAVRAWAIALRDSGKFRSSTLLDDDGLTIGLDHGVTPLPADGAVAGMTVVAVPDRAAAIELAKSFPGLDFGTEVELRAVKPLPGAPPR